MKKEELKEKYGIECKRIGNCNLLNPACIACVDERPTMHNECRTYTENRFATEPAGDKQATSSEVIARYLLDLNCIPAGKEIESHVKKILHSNEKLKWATVNQTIRMQLTLLKMMMK